jgi:phospholipid/cholesterol/gamma-HCH transport system permease protein
LGYLVGWLDFVGSIWLLAWRVFKLTLQGQANAALVAQQMVALAINAIPIAALVMAFAGATFSYVFVYELGKYGQANLTGGLLLATMLRELLPAFTAIVLAGRSGAAITSEIGSMKISEQLDALRALSTDPNAYLTLPRVLAGVVMMPLVNVFAGYAGWYGGYWAAHRRNGMSYATYVSSVQQLVDMKYYNVCVTKSIVFSVVLVLVACYYGFRAEGGAAGVGKVVTTGVVVNIVLIFGLDLLITALMSS